MADPSAASSIEPPPIGAEPRADRFAIRPLHVALLALILFVGGALRFLWIESTAVWCDELLSIHISNAHNFSVDALPRDVVVAPVPDLMSLSNAQPAWKVWSSMGGDMHPPLYYTVLRLWRELFGDSPLGIRSLSAVLGTLALLAAFGVGREASTTAGGLWTAALCAFASNHIYYSQEARMYAMMLLLVSIAMTLVLRIERLGFTTGRGVALAIVSLLAMLTLYLSAAVLIACAVYAAVRLRGRAWRGTMLCFVAAALVFALVWLPFMFGQHFHALKSDWLKADPKGHVVTTLLRFAAAPMNQFGILLPSSERYGYALAVMYVVPAFLLRRNPRLLLPWLAALLVSGIPLIADLYRTTNMLRWDRYTVALIPTLSVVLVVVAQQLLQRRFFEHALPAAMVLLGLLSLVPLYQKQRYDFRAYSRLAEKASLGGGGRLVCASTWNYKFNSVLLLSMQYYWKVPPAEVVFIEDVARLDELGPDVAPDRVILAAGDLSADVMKLKNYEFTGTYATWEIGVGSVHSLRRRSPAPPATQPAQLD